MQEQQVNEYLEKALVTGKADASTPETKNRQINNGSIKINSGRVIINN